MSIWSRLGIERTDNPEAIEQAYEHQLRFMDPDSQPERYRVLREAYESAMEEAGAAAQDEDFGLDEDGPLADVAMPDPPTQEAELKAGQLMTEIESLYANPGWRNDLRRWRAQLEGEKAHKPGVIEVLRFRVFEFLSRQTGSGQQPVSEEVLEYLDERLGWRRHRHQLEKTFSPERVNALLGKRSNEASGASSPLDLGPFPDSASGGDVPQGLPRGMGLALISWVLLLMMLTILLGEVY